MPKLSLLLLFPVVALSDYNETLAIAYANLAGAAYCSADVLRSWTCGVKCINEVTSVKVCQGHSTQAFVGNWNGKCVASFQGTNGMSSVAVDLSTFKTSFVCDGCKVHSGFLGEWNSLATCMKSSLEGIGCGKTQPLHATGHSLGAAVMAVGMFGMQSEGWNVVEMYNFGMPRIANHALVQQFDKVFKGRFYRVTHGLDPFIDMPPGPFYIHVEPEVFYKGTVQEGYVICTDPYDTKCAAQYFPDMQHVIISADVRYHHDYMGVDTTQGDCNTGKQSCHDDIRGSWCAYGIACNKDTRGEEAYCNYGSIAKLGYGMCHCNDGFCPVNGKCQKFWMETGDDPVSRPKGATLRTNSLATGLPTRAFPEISPIMPLALLGTLVLSLVGIRSLRATAPHPDLQERFITLT